MIKKIINLEINEVSPWLIREYILKNSESNLSKLSNEGKLSIYVTKAKDIPEDKLYPSQTWASFNTGKPYSEHKCYWYSDGIEYKNLLWNVLAKNDISVGILGSIHSSKYPIDLFSNKNYKYYIPDCFSNEGFTKPSKYKDFQLLNNKLVGDSGRVTNIKNLFKIFKKYILKIIRFPRSFGISPFSLSQILLIIWSSIISKNKEVLRLAQFPLIASIYTDLFKKYNPSYSTLFSNHVAGNMHRYWYAHNIDGFKNKNKYSKEWLKRNRNLIFLSIDLLDNYLGFLLEKKEFKNVIICITSSMGQRPNPKFDEKYLAKYDGKIINLELFLKQLGIFQKRFYKIDVDLKCARNMAPQYGFNLVNSMVSVDLVAESISKFIDHLGLENKIDVEGKSIVLSIDPYTDENFQNKYNISKAKEKLSKFGFDFFKIDDHHSGSHFEDGSLIVVNSSEVLTDSINKFINNDGYFNYLNFKKLITDYFIT